MTEISTGQTLAIGAGVGVAAGAGAGLAKGSSLAAKIVAPYKDVLSSGSVDEYVKQRIRANSHNITEGAAGKASTCKKYIKKIAEKAKKDYPEMVEKGKAALEKAKNTKVKWGVGLAAAGLAVGAGVAAIANKIITNKEASAE